MSVVVNEVELGMKSLPILSLLAITCWAAPIACGMLDALDSMVSNPICAVFGAGDFKKCMDKFEAELSSSDDKPLEVLQTRAICCSLTHLRKCVVDVISDHCGDKSGEVLDMVMRGAIEKIQDHSQCHDYDGNVASIICLPGN